MIVELSAVLMGSRVCIEVFYQQVAVALDYVWDSTAQKVVHYVSPCDVSLIKSVNSGERGVGLE